jgi:alpha-L-fucosidase
MTSLRKGNTDWFVKDRFGMFIHWGTYALGARHEWVKSVERIPTDEYMKYFDNFDPDLYDPREWARMAKEAGMKYFVITAKHHEGFCLWDSKHTDYKATNTPWGKDLLTPVVEAFRAEGLKVGFYYSLLDWHHPEYPADCHHPMRDDEAYRAGDKDRDISKYAQYMRDQVEELLTQFGKIDLLWFDFSFPGDDGKGHDDWESEKLHALVRDLAPEIIIDNRLDLPDSGDFVTPEQYQPRAQMADEDGNPQVWEACQTFSGSWGYHRDEQTWKSVKQLLQMLIDGVSKDGNLLLNVGPTGRGEFDRRAKAALAGMGDWMRVNERSIRGCGIAPKDLPCPPDCRYTYNADTNRLYLHLMSWPFRHIHCEGLADRIDYAQFLHDASEVKHWALDDGTLQLNVPDVAPAVEIPVIEIKLLEIKPLKKA